jgi:hypothetical protein
VDGDQVGVLTADKHGAGLELVRLPFHFAAGQHTMTATTPSGAIATTTFTVVTLGGLRAF